MQEQNPYAAPVAPVADSSSQELRLGGRGERLGAVLIDGLILLAILIPLMYVGGYFTGVMQGVQPGFGKQLTWSVIGFAILCAVQGYPLSETGQTWGKKLLKLKIVNLDGSQPDLLHLIGFRFGSTQLISLVPFVGALYGIVDALFIFREDKRCIHDLIAGTRVVVAE
jgi:uncharacterized RDD family membrane protein YckC